MVAPPTSLSRARSAETKRNTIHLDFLTRIRNGIHAAHETVEVPSSSLKREVARILEVPLEQLIDPARLVWRTSKRDDGDVTVPAFVVDGIDIWGATAMVLAEFLALARAR